MPSPTICAQLKTLLDDTGEIHQSVQNRTCYQFSVSEPSPVRRSKARNEALQTRSKIRAELNELELLQNELSSLHNALAKQYAHCDFQISPIYTLPFELSGRSSSGPLNTTLPVRLSKLELDSVQRCYKCPKAGSSGLCGSLRYGRFISSHHAVLPRWTLLSYVRGLRHQETFPFNLRLDAKDPILERPYPV